MDRTDPLQVGIFGYGLAGALFHAPFVAATPDLRLAAVSTSDPERRREAIDAYPGVRVFSSAGELLADPSLDIVVVATPNRTHVPLAAAAIEAGRAVVVDKPLAGTAAEAQQLLELAERRGVLLTVFQNRRWDGDFATLRQLVGDGQLGAVWRFESRFERWRPEVGRGWRDSAEPADAGGLLFDLGSHLVDQALVLFGRPTEVYAQVLTRRPGAAVDDDVFVALTHAGGVRSQLWMTATAAQAGPRFRVLGSSAGFVKYGMDPQEDALNAGRRPVAGGPWGVEEQSAWGRLGTDSSNRQVETRPGDYGGFYRQLAAALRGDAPVPVDPREAVAALAVIEAAARSSTTRSVVSLPPVETPPV
ncbi:MAG: scyllo-inositol 2-dehydrogenase [Pseudonocardiales bacterium]|jgi:predicted dehydrogenase|nr:scyllo-inositol 2-dehydrogenase [Pseudonocardiales bacterium]